MAERKTLIPKSEAEAADLVKQAASNGIGLAIEGAGSKAGIGQVFEPAQRLSSTGLSGIVEYNPAELVLVARTGTPLADIEKALAKNNQMLAFEPCDWGGVLGAKAKPTIGGVMATNQSGSRRFTHGAARDALLGVRFVNGDGEIIKNGGRVMKNVTGLDLVKLMAGSWGRLAFMTEVAVKVLPRPASSLTLICEVDSGEQATQILAAGMGTSADVTGAAHLPGSVMSRILGGALTGRPIALLRLEGFPESISERAERLKSHLKAMAHSIDTLDDKQTSSIWREIGSAAPFAKTQDKPLWRISAAPMAGPKIVEAVKAKTDCEAIFDWQGGLIWLQIEDEDAAHGDLVRASLAAHGGGHATLYRANDALRVSTRVFQPEPKAVRMLSDNIRRATDPKGVFSTERFMAE